MRIPVRAGWLWLPALVLFATGCDLIYTGPGEDFDAALHAQLEAASAGAGASYFRLPESDHLSAIPQDPDNPLTPAKVELGSLLFHEPGLLNAPLRPEGRATASCASCHHAGAGFQAGRRQGIGEGGWGFGFAGEGRVAHPAYPFAMLDVQPIRSPSALNVAYQPVMLWNGQFGATGPNAGTESRWTADTPIETNRLGYEGVETQAIAGLAVHRMGDVDTSVVARDATYRELFEAAFPGEPIDRERAGLAIAAYERTLLPTEAPFQRWLRGEADAMTPRQKAGALLFFGKANCASCHTGPALNSMSFHALGMADLRGADIFGTTADGPERLGRGGFTGRPEDAYRFKTPQLYNLADAGFLGHGATFGSVREVIVYKNRAEPENPAVPAEQLAAAFQPLRLTEQEVDALTAFVEEALRDPDLHRYVPEALPTGHCLPASDAQSRADLGCDDGVRLTAGS